LVIYLFFDYSFHIILLDELISFSNKIKESSGTGASKKMASDKNHRPCLPLKPQEKVYFPAKIL
jgi:hypothetical protein